MIINQIQDIISFINSFTKFAFGLLKHISYSRHTFATTVTLDNGVPIDSVSKMLGHRSIKTTQVYAKVTDKKISDDTILLYTKFQI